MKSGSVGKITRDVRNECCRESEEVVTLNHFKGKVRLMQMYRKSHFPDPPSTLHEIQINGKWELDACGKEQFLQIDEGEGNRILGFFTRFGLEQICKSKHVIGDGTFKVMPKLFTQLYVMHGEAFGKFLFFLLPDKSEATYVDKNAKSYRQSGQ